jgi:Protein of unknown function (DUF3088)
MRDNLIHLQSDFEDPAYRGRRFYCWHCVLLEGVLATFPHLNDALYVQRIPWARPGKELIDLLGPDNQELPVLIFAADALTEIKTREANGRRFVAGKDEILHTLSVRYGIPEPHP